MEQLLTNRLQEIKEVGKKWPYTMRDYDVEPMTNKEKEFLGNLTEEERELFIEKFKK